MSFNRQITSDTVFKCAPNLEFMLSSAELVVRRLDDSLRIPANGLLILDAFKTPTTIAAALSRLKLQIASPTDWMRVMDTIVMLIQFGALNHVSQSASGQPTTIDSVPFHLMLLDDTLRTSRYLDALREMVQPTDVVLDIGTGSGVLAAGAALAGAKHVYAVEGDPVAKAARAVFAANGLADRVTVIEGWSTQIDLPEPADLLVSEILSNGVFGQDILQVTRDAARRLLKPGARMIPYRVRMYALLVQVTRSWLAARHRDAEDAARWKDRYGIDFTPLLGAQPTQQAVPIDDPAVAQEWTYLSDPLLLADLDLTDIQSVSVDTTVTAQATASGMVSGALLFFEADLTPTIRLSTHPAAPDRPKAWSNPLWLCPPIAVEPGSSIQVRLTHTERFPLTYHITVTPSA